MKFGHQEILEQMRREILAGKFDGDNKLPSETANMLIAHRFDVTRRLKAGTNVVQVLLRPVLLDAQTAVVGEMGTAAALAARKGVSARALPYADLREALLKAGCRI